MSTQRKQNDSGKTNAIPNMEGSREGDNVEVPKAPPKKRSRKPKNAVASQVESRTAVVKGRGNVGKLSVLPNMSLDILYEVMIHLQPVDLISLSRVSKSFRKVLLSHSSITVWKTSFNNIPGLPIPPEDVALPAWANLVWGGVQCHDCGQKRVLKIDFMLRKRLCSECLMSNTCVSAGAVTKYAPDIPGHLYDCIPCTLENTRWGTRRVQLNDDIIAFQKDLRAFKKQISPPNDHPAAFECFRNKKLSELDTRQGVADAWSAYISQNAMQKSDKREEKKEIRRQAVLNRCLELGHEEVDCERALYHKSVNTETKLTEKAWDIILPQILPLIEECKVERLEDEREARKEYRDALITFLYYEGVRSLETTPLELSCFISLSSFRALPDINMLIEEDSEDTETSVLRIHTAVDTNMPKLATLAGQHEDAIFSLARTTFGASEAGVARPTNGTNLGHLSLATSIFVCGAPLRSVHDEAPFLHGLHVFAHTCERCRKGRRIEDLSEASLPRFSEKGSAMAVAILGKLGLDQRTATAADLERLDKRFVCLNCPLSVPHRPYRKASTTGPRGRYAYTWWSLIEHCYRHDDPSIAILNDIDTQRAKNAETATSFDMMFLQRKKWGCTRCDIHCQDISVTPSHNYMSPQNIKEHIRSAHAINDPQMHSDYFADPTRPHPARKAKWLKMSDD